MEVLMKKVSWPALKPGDIIEGAVLDKRGSRLFVDLGPVGTGIVYGREFYQAEDIVRNLEVGASVTAKVVDPDNEDGYIELSLKEAGRERDWQEIKKLCQEKTLIRLPIFEANRGGLILEYHGVSGFLPASQLSQEHYPRVEGGDKEKIYEELKKLVGREFEVAIIDFDSAEGKLIFSEKSKFVQEIERELAKFQVGDIVEGVVTGIVSFGAFVKFGKPAESGDEIKTETVEAGNLEGLVHISEIDWQLIASPSDVLKIGERVRAKIIAIESDRVSLSLKALKEDPWVKFAESIKKGDILSGTVVKFNPFGAFVKINDVVQGLAHISEFGTEVKMHEALELGKSYSFKIMAFDPGEHRLALRLATADNGAGEGNSDATQEPDAQQQ